MLLASKPVVSALDQETKAYITKYSLQGKWVAIFLLSDDKPSEVYVSLKAKKAHSLGLYADIKLGKDWSVVEVIDEIEQCNMDDDCLGIMIQLPLAQHLSSHQRYILDAITPKKDIDGLGSVLFGKAGFGAIDFLPATPKAALELLRYYKLDDVAGKHAVIIGRSNLIGKPLAIELIKRGATVTVCNASTPPGLLRTLLISADYIFSATGKKHLICQDVLDSGMRDKILVDIGRGSDADGPYGDIDWHWYVDKVQAITPVPGGVGPVTVSCLFHNIIHLGCFSS